MSIKIIAGDGLKEVLAKAVDIEALDSSAMPDDMLLVYAHALTADIARHSEYGGLQRLQEFLSLSRTQLPAIRIFGLLAPHQYGALSYLTLTAHAANEYLRLPCTASALLASNSSDGDVYKNIGQQWERAREQAIQNEQERICSIVRHQFVEEARPAIRIALGAYICGDISFAALEMCVMACPLNTDRYDFAPLLSRLRQLQTHTIEDTAPILDAPMKVYVGLKDDSERTRESWLPVLNTIFAGWLQKGLAGFHDREVVVTDKIILPTKLEALLLDYQLEPEQEGGLPFLGGNHLQMLKNLDLHCPIILFTGSDEAYIAKWCLQHGASDYFVKEMPEKDDRRSVEHYMRLKRVLTGAFQLDTQHTRAQARGLWTKYLDVRDQIVGLDLYYSNLDGGLNSIGNTDWYLRQAFRFLFEPMHWTHSKIVTATSPRYDLLACVIMLDLASETLCSIGLSLATHIMGQPCNFAQRSIAAQIMELQSWGLLEHFHGETFKDMTHIGHVYLKPPEIAELAGMLDRFREVLDFAARLAEDAEELELTSDLESEDNPFQLSDPPTGAPRPSANTSFGSHGTIARLGAEEFVDQAYEAIVSASPSSASTSRSFTGMSVSERLKELRKLPIWSSADRTQGHTALFLDDHVSGSDPWPLAIETLNYPYRFGKRQGTASCLKVTPANPQILEEHLAFTADYLGSFDVILLDLDMQKRREGLWWLQIIKQRAPEVPVVMFTASDDSYGVREAYRYGASDYFLKRGSLNMLVSDQNIETTNRYVELRRILHGVLQRNSKGTTMREIGRALNTLAPLPDAMASGSVPEHMFDEETARHLADAFHSNANLNDQSNPEEISRLWMAALSRHLWAAWGYLVRAEVISRPTDYPGMAFDNWLLDALSQTGVTQNILAEAHVGRPIASLVAQIPTVPSTGGAGMWVYVECGCVMELLANTYQAGNKISYRANINLGTVLKDMADILSMTQWPHPAEIWRRRNEAMHNRLPIQLLPFEELCRTVGATLAHVQTYLGSH